MNKRHVRSEWTLLEPPTNYKRAKALCGVTSTPDNCGVPGITKEAPSGWCRVCIKRLAAEVELPRYTLPTLQSIHNSIIAEVARCLGQESSILPLWHPHSESINNRRWIVWDMMMSRCYDMNNPDFYMWGGAGITVHDDWKSFKQFADDVPAEVSGVYPKRSMCISKDDSVIRVDPPTL